MVLLAFEGGVHRLVDDAFLVATGVHACRGRICIFVVAGDAGPGKEPASVRPATAPTSASYFSFELFIPSNALRPPFDQKKFSRSYRFWLRFAHYLLSGKIYTTFNGRMENERSFMKKESRRKTFQLVCPDPKEMVIKTRIQKMWQLEVLFLLTLYLILAVPLCVAAPATFTTIDVPGADQTAALGITPEGVIVGWSWNLGGVDHGFLLSKGGLTAFDFQGAYTDPWDVNPAGEIVGLYLDSSFVPQGFLLSKGVFTTIEFPGAYSTFALGINPQGDIVGRYFDDSDALNNNLSHGFLLRNGVFTTIDVPGYSGTAAVGIDPSGEIVGAIVDSDKVTHHGYLLSNGRLTSIDFPGASSTHAYGINLKGEIVGIYFDSVGFPHGYLLSKGVFTSIDVPGSIMTWAQKINPAGDIVGFSLDPDFIGAHGFLLSRGK